MPGKLDGQSVWNTNLKTKILSAFLHKITWKQVWNNMYSEKSSNILNIAPQHNFDRAYVIIITEKPRLFVPSLMLRSPEHTITIPPSATNFSFSFEIDK